MYHTFQVEDDKLLAISDKNKYVRVMPITEESKEKILIENKIEAYEKAAQTKEEEKKNFFHKANQNHKIAFISNCATVVITIVMMVLAIYFMPLTPLVTNVGLLTWVTSFVLGAFISNKAYSNEQHYYNKMLESDKLIEMIQQKITEEKHRHDFLNMANFYHVVAKEEKSILDERIEDKYNKQLKQQYLEIQAELKMIQQMAQKKVLQNEREQVMNDDFDIAQKAKQKTK